MNYVAVSSSNIAVIAYDEVGQILDVRFRTGREYWNHRVPSSVYLNLIRATSKGRYLAAFVRPKVPMHAGLKTLLTGG
jgi:hypothetical protein